ncbi:hypothetical protein ABEW24_24730 [Paenibacillus jamilae]|uniref:hypothetical protein n=1 Tax=Paenibacillus TaxID=44249 RepID=UPI00077C26B0|nr:hypothetical protein [Paenibacillus polymyxa]KYG97087.1 hypothetical protein AZE31_25400 [Paenibacillus polymyxa]
MTGWQVTANDISNWTETQKRRAEELLPLLVKRLILASCNPKVIDFPSGDSVAIGGWDGILEVEQGNEYIPAGSSGWEFGTNSGVKGKADDDYDKRTKSPSPLTTADSTFIFVTSRPWTQKNKWVEYKKLEAKWKDIKGINAEVLVEWLERCPAVHRWFAETIGKRSVNLWDIDQAWEKLSHSTTVNLTKDFFLYERDIEQMTLRRLLEGSPSVIRIKSQSKIEAYAFLLANLQQNESYAARCLVVNNQSGWDFISESNQTLILIPNGFQPNGIGSAVNKGHYVLISVDQNDMNKSMIVLQKQPRIARQNALMKLGFEEGKAAEIYSDTKGYLEPILRHELMNPIDFVVPIWRDNTSLDVLFAIFFATEWDENKEYDRKTLASLSNLAYEELEKIIIKLSKLDDPPIRKLGSIWQVVSKIDLWLVIARWISKPYLERFRYAINNVISEVDPSFELPSEKRSMANILGATPLYSKRLKSGLADSMAIVSVYGDEYVDHNEGDKPSSLISYWVGQLFKENNSTAFWYSNDGIMRLLAESAPNAFLDAVENSNSGNESAILGLFNTESDVGFGGCNHSGLLWALELVSWNKNFFSKACLSLARLSEIDPGGKMGDRPFNSLIDIFLGWVNNTLVTHEERLQVLSNVLIPQHPDIAWQLMIKLLFNNTTVSSGICKPEYREWSSDIEREVSRSSHIEYVRGIVDLLLLEAHNNTEDRIIDLIENFDSFDPEQQCKVIDLMFTFRINDVQFDKRMKIIAKLRETIAHHREFSDAKWAWPELLLSRLEEVLELVNFKDVINGSRFLFDDSWPDLIEPIRRKEFDLYEREKQLQCRRIEAFENILKQQGENGVKELLVSCKLPYLVGGIAYRSTYSDDAIVMALSWLEDKGNLGRFAKGLVSSFAMERFDDVKDILNNSSQWSVGKKVQFLLCMPLEMDTINLVYNLPSEGISLYWSNLNHYSLSGKNTELITLIATKLLENNRPLAAIDAVGQLFHGGIDTSDLNIHLISSILFRIATNPSDINKITLQHVRHTILEALEFLQDCGRIDESEIRQLEWMYLKSFKFSGFVPRYLMKSIAEEPMFFVQLITWGFNRQIGNDSVEDLDDGFIEQRQEIARELVDIAFILPRGKDGDLDPNLLLDWVKTARQEFIKAGRVDIGDNRIGHYLSGCPIGKDSIWPHESVRSVIENIKSNKLDIAIRVGHINARGMTSRSSFDGGEQERTLADLYNTNAELIQLTYPRTADILRSIARSYEHDASWQDREVELRDF